MKKLLVFVYIIFFLLSSIVAFSFALIIWLLTFWVDQKKRLLHYYTQLWAAMYIRINPFWKIIIDGRKNVDRNKVYVIVSNHQSLADIIAISLLFIPFKWVSKAEVFSVPFIGWNMRLNDYIKLERGNKTSIVNMLNQCKTSIKNGTSVYLFPEGTRSSDTQLNTFKTGAFTLAKEMNVPILPIVIEGTANILSKHSFDLNFKSKIRLSILEPIPFESFENKEVQQITDEVRELISQRMEKT